VGEKRRRRRKGKGERETVEQLELVVRKWGSAEFDLASGRATGPDSVGIGLLLMILKRQQ
jgi:hypothetical protein